MTDKCDFLTVRNGVWHYYRRVPREYAAVNNRSHVKLSTKIKVANDRIGAKAMRVAARMNATQEALWRGLVDGRTDAKQAYIDAIRTARALGLDYQVSPGIAQRPLGELLARVETLLVDGRIDNPGVRKSVLGGVEKPRILLSTLFTEYEATQKTVIAQMSPNQYRKWREHKSRAVSILIEQRGDKALRDLTRADAIAYAAFWEDRVVNEGINPNTANKNLGHISGMLHAVNKRLQLGLDAGVFAGLRLEGRDGHRSPFSSEFIRDRILAPGALDGLNSQAADIVLVCIETGCRPSEVANLSKARIVLDAEVPHIKIAAEGRLLKTETSERTIPLVGVALEAMKRRHGGFPRYYDKGGNLSATLMKFFRTHKLLPTARHSVYSLRHSFKDRLRAVEAPEELVDQLMGHANGKPKYGTGYDLKIAKKYLQAICLTPAAKVRVAA